LDFVELFPSAINFCSAGDKFLGGPGLLSPLDPPWHFDGAKLPQILPDSADPAQSPKQFAGLRPTSFWKERVRERDRERERDTQRES